MRKKRRHFVSLGTIVMLTLTALVLLGFFFLLPKLMGNADVRTNAAELAVAIDSSISKLTSSVISNRSTETPVPVPPTSFSSVSASTPAPATPEPTRSFSLCAAGSIKINSTVQKALTDDDGYCFELLFDHLTGRMSADLSIATLENSVIPDAKTSDSNLPQEALIPIHNAGINALSLGYLNVLDAGIDGLSSTKQSILASQITPYGVYASQAERDQGVFLELNGIKVALLSFQTEISSAGKKKTTEEERAFAYSSAELSVISSEIAALRSAGAEVVVVSLCWGKTGATSPTNAQIELAQGIADAGADIILGTHSGALQTIEILTANRGDGKYHPVLCAYSLGNLFTYEREKRSSLASILLNAEVVYDPATGCVAFDNLSYIPTYSWRDKVDGTMRYRTLINDGIHYPDYVTSTQKDVMERCYTLVEGIMKDTVIPMATE